MAEVAAAAAVSVAIFAGKTAAQAAITYFTNKTLDRLLADGEDHRQRLQVKLLAIKAIFRDVDCLQVRQDPDLGPWLWLFQDAMEVAEDALDELDYLDLERKTRNRKQKRVSWKQSFNFWRPVTDNALRRHAPDPLSLKEALETLNLVAETANSIRAIVVRQFPSSSKDDFQRGRETTRELTTTVFGREEDKDTILQWLGIPGPVHTPEVTQGSTSDQVSLQTREITNGNSYDQQPIQYQQRTQDNVSVCTIVGNGGMGKTTLAQQVCQDKRVQDQFDKIIWVHVSMRFDSKILMKRILEKINLGKANVESSDVLKSSIDEVLMCAKFLLILDDVWEDVAHDTWKPLLISLTKSTLQGRIVLTTRLGSVADTVRNVMPLDRYKCLELTGLEEKHILKIFNYHAFGDSRTGNHEKLQLVGEQIVKKLAGCPLIAEIIGSQLKGKTDRSEWDNILIHLNQNIHLLDGIAPKVMDVLKLSYTNLTSEVQLCFRYCSIFPPHHKFRMEELIEMWVSSGLIMRRKNNIKSLEDIARDHFYLLVEKTFFKLIPRELHADPYEDKYVMHDMIYELACSVSIGECLWLKASECKDMQSHLTLRHLSIEGLNPEVIRIISESKYLRTLIIANKETSLDRTHADELLRAIRNNTSLRLLMLDGNCWDCVNDVISELKHLRYISMATSESNLNKLFKLYHLQIIKLPEIERGKKVHSIDISNLIQLQKLYLPKGILSRIPHIGRLTSLRELNGFSVKTEEGYRITELKDLNKLRKVIVLDVQNVRDDSEASSAELENKVDMKLLSLEWCADAGSRNQHQILERLIPHENLRRLNISGYNGTKPPGWLGINYLQNLLHLKLDGCLKWDELPSLGKMSTVKHLFLEHLPNLKHIAGSKGLPPNLVTLVVKECPELLDLPDLPFSLQHLRINEVKLSSLPVSDQDGSRNISTEEPELTVVHIEHCDYLVSLLGSFLEEQHHKSLTNLQLIHCSILDQLPDEEFFERVSKFESIKILECNNLSSLGGLGALSYLKVLEIKCCSNLTASLPEPLMASSRSLLELYELEIDDDELLLQNPLRNFSCTRRLIISSASKMTKLPEEWLLKNISVLEHIEIKDAALLESFPSDMEMFDSLRSLCMDNIPLLRSLPVRMPPKLWSLFINGCHAELDKQCQPGGSEWYKICSIPTRCISCRK